tara:strand:+ start:1963 stop:3894 length:1932 start_codon:yes stop_codon:yes gene_type:complete
MTFILPTALNLHRDTAQNNVGSIGGGLTLKSKSGGNLPITEYASRIQYASDIYGGTATAQGVFFGTDGQNNRGELDASTGNPLLLIWSVQFNSPNRIQVADIAQGGVRLWVGAGSDPINNYREYYIGGNDTPFASAMAGPATICVDLNSQGFDSQTGYFDAEDVSAYGIATVHESISGDQFGEIHCQRAFVLEAGKAASDLPFFVNNPIVIPQTFASGGVDILMNGGEGDTLQVFVDNAHLSYALSYNDSVGNVTNTAISFVEAWNTSTNFNVSQYIATSNGGGSMTFTAITAIEGQVLPVFSGDGGSLQTVVVEGDTGKAHQPLYSTDFDAAVSAVQGVDYSDKIGNWLTKVGSTYFIPVPFAFGDGTNPISFNDNDVNVESPTNNSTGQQNFRIEDSTMSVFLRLRTTYAEDDENYDNVYLGGTYTWGTAAPWDFDVASSNASCILAGTFKGMGDFTMGSCVTASGDFNCNVKSKGADITDITITGNLSIMGDSVVSFTDVSCDGAIDFDTAGTYSFAGGELGYFTNSSGGNIVINVASDVRYDNYNEEDSITIAQATRSLTLTGLVTGTEVRVFDSTTLEALGGVEDSDLSGTFTMPISANSVNIVVHHLEYEWLSLPSVDTSSSKSILIQQRFDRGYSA